MGREQMASGRELHGLFQEVFRLQAVLSGMIDTVHGLAGMRTSQVRLGTVLSELGEGTVPDVAHLMMVSRQYVQVAANEMEAMGFVVFKDNPRHKRSKLVCLTEKGRAALESTGDREAAIVEQGFPDVAKERVHEARSLLLELRERAQSLDMSAVEWSDEEK